MPQIVAPARRMGKTAALERSMAEYIKRHPRAVIVRVERGEIRVERPVEELGPLRLPKPTNG